MVVCDDLALPEGPLALPDGTWLVTELALRRGCITQVLADGTRREIARTGRPNGLARTADGAIWVAESLTPSIVRLTLDGQVKTVLTHVGDVPLLWPNDICVGPDGAIYFTDSGALVTDFLDGDELKPDFASVRFDGRIVRYDTQAGSAQFLDSGLAFANGIAFGADRNLYATETFTGEVYRYRTDGARVMGSRERFGSVLALDWAGDGLRGPDGIAFSTDGRLWCAVFGQGDISVLGSDGALIDRIPLAGHSPTNIAFDSAGSRIYVTEDELGQLIAHPVDATGVVLFE